MWTLEQMAVSLPWTTLPIRNPRFVTTSTKLDSCKAISYYTFGDVSAGGAHALGFYFRTPVDITIVGLNTQFILPGTTTQSVEIVISDTSFANQGYSNL